MDNFEINVEGIEEACAMLDKAPRQIVKYAFAKAATRAAAVVVKALRPRVPVKTGDLADHIVTDIAIDRQGRGVTAKIGFGNRGFKARMVEYGHRMIGHAPDKKDLGIVEAHPFMRPTAATAAEEAVEAFTESLRESLAGQEIPEIRTAA